MDADQERLADQSGAGTEGSRPELVVERRDPRSGAALAGPPPLLRASALLLYRTETK